jgi:hypothetical protein
MNRDDDGVGDPPQLAGVVLLGYAALTGLGLALAGSVGALAGRNALWVLLPVVAALGAVAVFWRLRFVVILAWLLLAVMVVVAAVAWGSIHTGGDIASASVLSLFPLGLFVTLMWPFLSRRRV